MATKKITKTTTTSGAVRRRRSRPAGMSTKNKLIATAIAVVAGAGVYEVAQFATARVKFLQEKPIATPLALIAAGAGVSMISPAVGAPIAAVGAAFATASLHQSYAAKKAQEKQAPNAEGPRRFSGGSAAARARMSAAANNYAPPAPVRSNLHAIRA